MKFSWVVVKSIDWPPKKEAFSESKFTFQEIRIEDAFKVGSTIWKDFLFQICDDDIPCLNSIQRQFYLYKSIAIVLRISTIKKTEIPLKKCIAIKRWPFFRWFIQMQSQTICLLYRQDARSKLPRKWPQIRFMTIVPEWTIPRGKKLLDVTSRYFSHI